MVKQDCVGRGGGVWWWGVLFGYLHLMVLSPKMICNKENSWNGNMIHINVCMLTG